MKAVVCLLALLAISSAAALSDTEYAIEFGRFMAKHSKAYSSLDEQGYRFRVFKNNLDFINSHDAASKGFTVAVNAFTDLTNAEFVSRYLGTFNRTRRTLTRLHKVGDLNALPTLSTGEPRELSPPLRTKANVVLAGLSLPLVPWRVPPS